VRVCVCVCVRVCVCACLSSPRFCSASVGARRPLKNSGSHIDASHSRQPLVKGERLVRYEVNAVMLMSALQFLCHGRFAHDVCLRRHLGPHLCYLNGSAIQRASVVAIGAIAISLRVAVLGWDKDGGLCPCCIVLWLCCRGRVFHRALRRVSLCVCACGAHTHLCHEHTTAAPQPHKLLNTRDGCRTRISPWILRSPNQGHSQKVRWERLNH
jgi:hypothetical protein